MVRAISGVGARELHRRGKGGVDPLRIGDPQRHQAQGQGGIRRFAQAQRDLGAKQRRVQKRAQVIMKPPCAGLAGPGQAPRALGRRRRAARQLGRQIVEDLVWRGDAQRRRDPVGAEPEGRQAVVGERAGEVPRQFGPQG
ncbi:MAG: hypothetical protein VX463_18820 [Pseudomonadota bacterium]|nr:hypothetical protein [Pseudomonadota bacterium]